MFIQRPRLTYTSRKGKKKLYDFLILYIVVLVAYSEKGTHIILKLWGS